VADETAKVLVKGVPPYDGEYELDTDRAFNTREWRWIKAISGYMPNTIREGLAGGDPAMYVAITVIAMCRAGRIDRDAWQAASDVLSEQPYQMEGGAITIVYPDEDDSPLELTSEPAPPSQQRPLENPTFSGDSSTNGSGLSDKTPSSTGTSESDTSVRLSVLKASAS